MQIRVEKYFGDMCIWLLKRVLTVLFVDGHEYMQSLYDVHGKTESAFIHILLTTEMCSIRLHGIITFDYNN